jgi:hypothetical protein
MQSYPIQSDYRHHLDIDKSSFYGIIGIETIDTTMYIIRVVGIQTIDTIMYIIRVVGIQIIASTVTISTGG